MSLPLITFVSGICGVFFVMACLMTCVILSSKLAIALEGKKEMESRA